MCSIGNIDFDEVDRLLRDVRLHPVEYVGLGAGVPSREELEEQYTLEQESKGDR